MINIDITNLLFIDIETVGCEKSYVDLKNNQPVLHKQFINHIDYFTKRFPETQGMSLDEIFYNRMALIPEFGKIVCVSVALVTPNGEIRKQSFYGNNEKEILSELNNLFRKVNTGRYHLCGHNIKNFDIPYIQKRMIINGILPSSFLPKYDTKPWEMKVIDTMELWKFGNSSSIASLELMCSVLGIDSSKEGDVIGNKVHESYWIDNKIEQIKEYCERDVDVLVQIINKLKELQ
jgi:hypothetical protein